MTDFSGVIEAWRKADPDHIHPLRRANIDDYWSSGVAQALEVTEYTPQGGTVVDFGCGDGRLSLPLSLFGYEVIAVDSSTEMLRRLRQNQKDRGGDLPTILNSTGLNLREVLSNAGFGLVDTVVARAVLIHHDSDSQRILVDALASVLKPGGHLIADWPVGNRHERRDWIDVTVIPEWERTIVAAGAGLELVDGGTPSVWVRI